MSIEWHGRAACVGQPHQLFFPDRGAPVKDVYAEAREICEPCPVRWECLDVALRTEQQGFRCGMFGGLSPTQRDRWMTFRRRAAREAVA